MAEAARKPIKVDQFGRDPESPPERLRKLSSYAKGYGYAPLYHAMLADIPRLSSGNTCTLLLLMILSDGMGRGSTTTERRQEWTDYHELEYWASLCRASVRQIQRERDHLKLRGLVETATDTKRRVAFRLRHRHWQEAIDYSAWLQTPQGKTWQKGDDEQVPDEPAPTDPAQPEITATTTRLVKTPVRVQPGKAGRKVPVNCGVKAIRLDGSKVEKSLDLRLDLVVKAGELWITPQATLKQSAGTGVQKSKNVAAKRDKTVPDDTHVARSRSAKAYPRKIGETPPPARGKELAALFDPLLEQAGARLLSFDSHALAEACEKIGDTDINYLIKFVMDRANSGPIRGPKVCVLICDDARKAWQAGAKHPEAQPSKKDARREQMIAEMERRERMRNAR